MSLLQSRREAVQLKVGLCKCSDEAYGKLLEVSGGSYGQPFKGENNFPDTPGEMS